MIWLRLYVVMIFWVWGYTFGSTWWSYRNKDVTAVWRALVPLSLGIIWPYFVAALAWDKWRQR